MSTSNRSTRSGSQSSANTFNFDDFKRLIEESEARIMTRLQSIESSISSVESRFDSIQAAQVRLDLDLKNVKDVIVKQQEYIERIEKEKRECNLIFSGIPEKEVTFHHELLSDDTEKVEALGQEIIESFSSSMIASCSRLGRNGDKRPLLVKFYNTNVAKTILYQQKVLRDNHECKNSFGTIYANRDLPTLSRLEERRIRQHMKSIKEKATPNSKIYLKHGKLFVDREIVDQISIANQLF